MSSIFFNKRGGSSGIPREIYIFSIIIIYGIFFFLYTAFGNTMYEIDNNYIQPTGDKIDNPVGTPEETKGLLSYVITGFTGMPDFLNWIFAVLSAMIILLIIIVLIHG